MGLSRVFAALLGTACASLRPGPVTVGAPVTADSAVAVTVLPPPADASVSVPEARRLGFQQTLCGERADCAAQKVFTALGTDGDARFVVLVREKFSVSSGDVSRECQGNEVWVVREAEDGTVIDRQLIGAGCAEDFSYSAACNAVVSIQPPKSPTQNTVVVAWEGPGPRCGGAQRASGDIEVSLESFAVVHRSEWYSRTIGPENSLHTYLRGDTTSLGRILSFSAEAATCHLDGNRLLLSTPPRDPERALLDAVGLE